MKLAALYSGGKDSNLAVYKALQLGYEISVLITIIPENYGTLFHYPNAIWTSLQAEAADIPIIHYESPVGEIKELHSLKEALKIAKKEYDIEGVVTGAIRSTYQATRYQKVCDSLDLWCFNPLWLKNERSILQEILENNFEVIITGVSAYPLTEKFLGKKMDTQTIQELTNLKKYINIVGEGGEFETFVTYAPFFKKRIKITKYKTFFDKDSWTGQYIILDAELV